MARRLLREEVCYFDVESISESIHLHFLGIALWGIVWNRILPRVGSGEDHAGRDARRLHFARLDPKLHDQAFDGRVDVGTRPLPSPCRAPKWIVVQFAPLEIAV